MVDTTDEWIVTRTGIRERRLAGDDETVVTMGHQAALNALDMAGIPAGDIDLIVVGTTSSTHGFPSAACEIQKLLGIDSCISFDVAAACAGFSYAISVVDQFIKTDGEKPRDRFGCAGETLIRQIAVRLSCLVTAQVLLWLKPQKSGHSLHPFTCRRPLRRPSDITE